MSFWCENQRIAYSQNRRMNNRKNRERKESSENRKIDKDIQKNRKGMVTNMEQYRLHTGWTFCLDERNEKEETAAPKEGFRPVTLPHDWSTDYPFDPESPTCGSGGYAKAGIGWYQRTITFSA